MSEIKVDTIGPRVDNGTLTIGASGDTVNIAGTAGTGFPAGTTLSGSTNNQVTTVTGANAITGEANLTYNGTILGVGASADLGSGIHVKASDTSASVLNSGEQLVLERNSDCGMTILTATDATANIYFGDSGDNDIGRIQYAHGSNVMYFTTNASEAMRIDSSGNVMVGVTSSGNSGKDTFTIQRNSTGLGLYIRIADGSSTYNGMQVRVDRDSAGEYNYVVYENNGGTEARIQDNGNMFNTNNSYGALSDERIKENLTDANSQWNDIKALKIKNYKYKDKSKAPTQLGVIAQDLETANMSGLIEEFKPDVSHIKINSDFGTLEDDLEKPILDENKNETGEYEQKVKTVNSKVKSVKYSVLYMKAIKALQESMERIEQLEAKVTALENPKS